MKKEEAIKLSDEELFYMLLDRIDDEVCEYDEVLERMASLKDAKKIFYILSYYDLEIQDGGLCQFFVNSSRDLAPYISDCLSEIGALEQRQLYDNFLKDNNIDPNDLSSFIIDNDDEYIVQAKRYPFDNFDDDIDELTPLKDSLMKYVRNHIEDF